MALASFPCFVKSLRRFSAASISRVQYLHHPRGVFSFGVASEPISTTVAMPFTYNMLESGQRDCNPAPLSQHLIGVDAMNYEILAQFRDRLHYNPTTGIFTWKKTPKHGSVKAGDCAGNVNKGY